MWNWQVFRTTCSLARLLTCSVRVISLGGSWFAKHGVCVDSHFPSAHLICSLLTKVRLYRGSVFKDFNICYHAFTSSSRFPHIRLQKVEKHSPTAHMLDLYQVGRSNSARLFRDPVLSTYLIWCISIILIQPMARSVSGTCASFLRHVKSSLAYFMGR